MEFKDKYNEPVTTTKSGVDIARNVHLTGALKGAGKQIHRQRHHHVYEHNMYKRDRRGQRQEQVIAKRPRKESLRLPCHNRQGAHWKLATGCGYGEFQKTWVRKSGSWRDPSYRTEGACKNAAQHEGATHGEPESGRGPTGRGLGQASAQQQPALALCSPLPALTPCMPLPRHRFADTGCWGQGLELCV